MHVGKGTLLPKIGLSWPHQVTIGKNCRLEHGISFKFDGIYKNGPNIVIKEGVFLGANVEFNIRKHILIGKDCLIGSGSKFIDHDHGTNAQELIKTQNGKEKEILIESDVWIGSNVIVLKGVKIGKGAIVGANSLVNVSIPEYEIWGGNPIKFLRNRK